MSRFNVQDQSETALQTKFKKDLAEAAKNPENRLCADCGARGTLWASANLGIFLCIRCAGIHRSLGVHISFVRSLTLDKWKAEHVENMKTIGNARAKEIYEANIPSDYHPPTGDDLALERWIRRKYEHKEFMNPHVKPSTNGHAPSNKKNKKTAKKNRKNKKPIAPKEPAQIAPAPPNQISAPTSNAQPLLLLDAADEFSGFQSATPVAPSFAPAYSAGFSVPLTGQNYIMPNRTSMLPNGQIDGRISPINGLNLTSNGPMAINNGFGLAPNAQAPMASVSTNGHHLFSNGQAANPSMAIPQAVCAPSPVDPNPDFFGLPASKSRATKEDILQLYNNSVVAPTLPPMVGNYNHPMVVNNGANFQPPYASTQLYYAAQSPFVNPGPVNPWIPRNSAPEPFFNGTNFSVPHV